jgi:hypothetical protein
MTTNQSNDLRHTASKTKGGKVIIANIRLNDECKNGHQDFAITGEIYLAGKPSTDAICLGMGCVHDEILKAGREILKTVFLVTVPIVGAVTLGLTVFNPVQAFFSGLLVFLLLAYFFGNRKGVKNG